MEIFEKQTIFFKNQPELDSNMHVGGCLGNATMKKNNPKSYLNKGITPIKFENIAANILRILQRLHPFIHQSFEFNKTELSF